MLSEHINLLRGSTSIQFVLHKKKDEDEMKENQENKENKENDNDDANGENGQDSKTDRNLNIALYCQSCHAPVDGKLVTTVTELRLEGVVSRVDAAIADIEKFCNINLKDFERIGDYSPRFRTFKFAAALAAIRRDDTSGPETISSPSVRSSSYQNAHYVLKEMINKRDKYCRLHGEKCDNMELSNFDSWVVGHLSSVMKKDSKIAFIAENDLTNDVRNGYKLCPNAEWCWTNDLWVTMSEN